MSQKIIRNENSEILCEFHNLIVDHICLEENCIYKLNCFKCQSQHQKMHQNFAMNIAPSSILNENLICYLLKENEFKEDHFIQKIEKDIQDLRNLLNAQIDSLEKQLIQKFKMNCDDYKFNIQYETLQKSRKQFLLDNTKFENLKSLANEFKKLFAILEEKESGHFLDGNKVLNFIQNDISAVKNDFLYLITKFEKQNQNNRNLKTEIKKTSQDQIYNFEKCLNINSKKALEKLSLKGSNSKQEIETKQTTQEDLHNGFDFSFSNIERNAKQLQQQLTTPKTNLFLNSKILEKEDLAFVNEMFDNKLTSSILLYRGSDLKFSARLFHKKCDKKSKTITFMKDKTFQNKFGGFNSLGWLNINGNGHCFLTQGSFLFSITHKKKLLCKKDQEQFSIFYGDKCLPSFGGGCDLFISDKAHKNTKSFSNLGATFQLPFDYVYGSQEARNFLAGNSNFSLEEIEVYEIK